jgi:hypothetical protein
VTTKRTPGSRPFGSENETQPEIRLPEDPTRSGTRRRPNAPGGTKPVGRVRIGTYTEIPVPKRPDPRRED